ncbi:MipA/OmpV family protein [Nitratireductor aquimarinus]|nr:MipA/OmpV family protein [Nitratireductor aquibiodomus]MBN8244301.1 MipA/OmpV family protein [Nitratireductor aquimarinus]MBY6132691.1 MipA/OmpV family protein [Nitratireductor aquimarinus]
MASASIGRPICALYRLHAPVSTRVHRALSRSLRKRGYFRHFGFPGSRSSALRPHLAAILSAPLVAASLALAPASAQEGGSGKNFWSGDWSVTVGASGAFRPEFEGSRSHLFSLVPLVSVGRQGNDRRFSSRNDNGSFALFGAHGFEAGLTGKFLFKRDADDANDLKGLDPVKWGVEAGGFAEVYPTDWLRVRGELRHGFRAHSGFVADVAADAFYDVTPHIRISGGPRASFASKDYFETYYGVNAREAAASGLSEYQPDGGGLKSLGVGGAVTWKVTDAFTSSVFAEYASLKGAAADSSLVRERGSRNQFTIGLSSTYRFDFTLD